MAALLRYPGKVVIVTRGTSDIGVATVREFVRQGANVVFCAKASNESQVSMHKEKMMFRVEELKTALNGNEWIGAQGAFPIFCSSPSRGKRKVCSSDNCSVLSLAAEKGQAIQRDLQSCGWAGDAFFQVCDVCRESDIQRLIQVTLQRYGCLDCVVNLAEHAHVEPLEDVTAQEFSNNVDRNVVSCFLVCKYALPYLRETKGNIVNLGRLAAVIGIKDALPSVTSKGAVIAMTKALAIDESKCGVRVNSISPGHITSLWEKEALRFRNPEAVLQEVETYQPMGRMGTPDEVALAILFLAADATFCTGLNLLITGGAELGFGIKSQMGPDCSALSVGNLVYPPSNE
ncbi:L-fucose dehydrogenase-like [Paroedura picta]|uniref:L-fucose dehydrogenase-like n=1 Tax=Paroedura picta TaxID=143630 RepID=UPI0040576E5E